MTKVYSECVSSSISQEMRENKKNLFTLRSNGILSELSKIHLEYAFRERKKLYKLKLFLVVKLHTQQREQKRDI
jgi:hypothetical protein